MLTQSTHPWRHRPAAGRALSPVVATEPRSKEVFVALQAVICSGLGPVGSRSLPRNAASSEFDSAQDSLSSALSPCAMLARKYNYYISSLLKNPSSRRGFADSVFLSRIGGGLHAGRIFGSGPAVFLPFGGGAGA